MVQELIDKYVFLVQTFVTAGETGLSWPQVQRKWEDRYGESYPRRSFVNHRKGVEEVFGVVIACDRRDNRYRIDDAENAVDKREAVRYLIDTFTVGSLLTLGKERLSGRVSVEDVPSGQHYLTPLMQAMLDGAELTIGYRKYLSKGSDQRRIRPYAVKEFEKRWYVVAWSRPPEALRVYALDRVTSMERTGEHFSMPEGFRVEEVFANSYGIYLPEDEGPVLVRLKASLREAAYLQDLPLHPSQVLESRGAEHCIFALYLIPNPNLVMDLCKRGDRLEVLEPAALREAVKQVHKNALQLYEP